MESRRLYVFSVLQAFAMLGLIWLLITWKSPWNLQRYIGTALAAIGIIFIVMARLQLGKSFSIRPEAHKLVTTGIYSKIRNPIYVFGTVLVIGLFLVLQIPKLWFLLIVLAAAQTVRARREAHVLEATFGDEYREYRRRTWF